MDEEFYAEPTHGILQMQDFLFEVNFLAIHKRAGRLLRKIGIMAIYSKRKTSKLDHIKNIPPNCADTLLPGTHLTVWMPKTAWLC